MQSCDFCAQAAVDHEPSRIVDTPLMQTSEYVGWASVGALIEGWTLALPRQHVLSTGDLERDQSESFKFFVESLSSVLKTAYGLPVQKFEHGPTIADSAAGCSIDHAHMHLVPTSLDLITLANEYYPQIVWAQVADVEQARTLCDSGESYLFLSIADGKSFAARGRDIPSQFFRRVIARALNLGEPEWRKEPRWSTSISTVMKVTSILGSANRVEPTLA